MKTTFFSLLFFYAVTATFCQNKIGTPVTIEDKEYSKQKKKRYRGTTIREKLQIKKYEAIIINSLGRSNKYLSPSNPPECNSSYSSCKKYVDQLRSEKKRLKEDLVASLAAKKINNIIREKNQFISNQYKKGKGLGIFYGLNQFEKVKENRLRKLNMKFWSLSKRLSGLKKIEEAKARVVANKKRNNKFRKQDSKITIHSNQNTDSNRNNTKSVGANVRLRPVQKGNRWGFRDKLTNKLIIDYKYSRVVEIFNGEFFYVENPGKSIFFSKPTLNAYNFGFLMDSFGKVIAKGVDYVWDRNGPTYSSYKQQFDSYDAVLYVSRVKKINITGWKKNLAGQKIAKYNLETEKVFFNKNLKVVYTLKE